MVSRKFLMNERIKAMCDRVSDPDFPRVLITRDPDAKTCSLNLSELVRGSPAPRIHSMQKNINIYNFNILIIKPGPTRPKAQPI